MEIEIKVIQDKSLFNLTYLHKVVLSTLFHEQNYHPVRTNLPSCQIWQDGIIVLTGWYNCSDRMVDLFWQDGSFGMSVSLVKSIIKFSFYHKCLSDILFSYFNFQKVHSLSVTCNMSVVFSVYSDFLKINNISIY
jgi:hypothetical protein